MRKLNLKKNANLKDLLIAPDDSDIGNFVAVDLKSPDETKEKTKIFPFCPENKISPHDKFNDFIREMIPNNYTPKTKLACD